MKKGWTEKSLGSLVNTGAGGTPLKSREDYYLNGTIPWLRSGEVRQGQIFTSKILITKTGLTESSAKLFPINTVLVAMYGATAGQVGILKLEAATNQAVCGILPSENFIPEFLYYLLLSKKEELLLKAVGNAQPNISQAKIRTTKVPEVSLNEQKQIVAILDKAFSAIDQAKANIEKNIANAEELFQSKLNAVFSQRGAGWEEKTLMEAATVFGRGKSKHRPRNDETLYGGKYPFVQTGDIRNAHKTVKNFTQTYNDRGLEQSKLWPKGTICITIAANIAESAILDFEGCFPDSIIGLVADNKKADTNYIYYSLQFLKGALQKLGKGSAQDNINLGTFKNQYFPFPKLVKQREIVSILDKLSLELKNLEKKYFDEISKLDDLKKSILQKAFAGELTSPERTKYTKDGSIPSINTRIIKNPEKVKKT